MMARARRALTASDLWDDRARAFSLTPVSRETAERLDRFVELLLKWQRTSNLVAESTTHRLWTRHVSDSLQLLDLAPEARIWMDLGSGAGFPGLVLGCALADRNDATVHLLESNAKKAAFLREAIRVSGAAAKVHHERVEAVVPAWREPVDIVTARALAPLWVLAGLAAPLVKRGAKALFLKGQDIEAELTETTKCWNIEAVILSSRTDSRGRIVEVRALEPRNGKLH